MFNGTSHRYAQRQVPRKQRENELRKNVLIILHLNGSIVPHGLIWIVVLGGISSLAAL